MSINAAMLITAAAVFHTRGLFDVGDDLEEVYDGLGTHLGSHANILFGIAPARLGSLVVERRDDVRPGRDAGLHPRARSRCSCGAR